MPQTALREMSAIVLHPRAVSIWFAVTLIAALIGPFGTDRFLSVPGRIAYWSVINGLSIVFTAASIVAIMNNPRIAAWPIVARATIGSIAVGLAVTLATHGVNFAIWKGKAEDVLTFVELLGVVIAITVAVGTATTVFYAVAANASAGPAAVETPPPQDIRFFKRIPRHLGRDLVSVSVQDHYCEVVTGAGRTLVLMRFADAVTELAAAEGMQIHRSHWIAFDAVAGVRRSGNNLSVRLKDGRELPVSRSRLAAVREKLRV